MKKNQPHIAIFLGYLGGGGAEIAMLNLAQSLSEYHLQVDLVLSKALGNHLQKIPPNVHLVNLGASSIFSALTALTHYLKQEQPTGLVSTLHYANEIALWAKRLARVPTRVVVSEQNTLSLALQKQSQLKKRFVPFFVKNFYPWADGIVACSQGVAQDLAEIGQLPLENIHPIYNPVVSPALLEKARKPLDHPWFQPGELPVILGVGKLEAQKDFSTLIRAFAQVRKVKPARLVILGWGPARPHLEALVQELGVEKDVDLPGYVYNPYAYMAQSKVFALSSAWEGFGNVLVEAMSVGTPVVSTDCKSGPAEILNNGQYGFLTPVGEDQALAKSILSVLSGHNKSVEQSWIKQFSVKAVTQQYCKVLGISLDEIDAHE